MIKLSVAARNAKLQGFYDLLNTGTVIAPRVELYDGTRPADPSVAITTQDRLATFYFNDPLGSIANGAFTMDLQPDLNAYAGGGIAAPAYWARIFNRDEVAVMDCDVSLIGDGGTIQLTDRNITAGHPYYIDSAVLTEGNG